MIHRLKSLLTDKEFSQAVEHAQTFGLTLEQYIDRISG